MWSRTPRRPEASRPQEGAPFAQGGRRPTRGRSRTVFSVTTEDDDEEETVLRPPVVLKVATDAEAKACEAALTSFTFGQRRR